MWTILLNFKHIFRKNYSRSLKIGQKLNFRYKKNFNDIKKKHPKPNFGSLLLPKGVSEYVVMIYYGDL